MKDWTSQEEDSSRRDQSDAISQARSVRRDQSGAVSARPRSSGDLAAPHNLRQGRGSAIKDVKATNVLPVQFFFVRAFGIIQMLPPDFQLSAQPVEIEIGKRAVRAVEIAHGTLQNRARADMVASGLVMKGNRQLNHTLEVQTEMPTRAAVGRHGAPDVFENFMSVEKVGAVEERYAVPKRVSLHTLVS
jgi:hypothetical protein